MRPGEAEGRFEREGPARARAPSAPARVALGQIETRLQTTSRIATVLASCAFRRGPLSRAKLTSVKAEAHKQSEESRILVACGDCRNLGLPSTGSDGAGVLGSGARLSFGPRQRVSSPPSVGGCPLTGETPS